MIDDAKLDRRIAWGLFAAGALVLLATEKPVGFTRDESVYFYAAESYARWFQSLLASPSEALTDAGITRNWDVNHEHPALMKTLFGLSFVLLHEKLGLLRPAAAFRVPAFLVAAMILPLVFLFVRKLFGRGPGIFAALSFFLVPRQFYNAHLSCFDVPIAAMWLLTVYGFWQAQEKPRWWLYTGLFFGLALGTKHNAYFIPLTLIPFSLVLGWKASAGKPVARSLFLGVNGVFVYGALLYALAFVALERSGFERTFLFLSAQTALFLAMVGAGAWLLRLLWQADQATFRAVAPLVAMAALGPVIFYAHWPYLWHHPVDRTAWYLDFHATHNNYTWFYLGELLRDPPFPLDYVVNVTALTVPTSLFVPMVLGLAWVAVRVWKREASWLEVLVAVNGLVSIAIISHPQVPHFGGVKHWFPSMPFLAMLAAGSVSRGASGLWALLKRRMPLMREARVFAVLAVLLGLPALVATARVYEFGTSAYSELAGGLPGAASLGMQRQFWANNVTGVLPWINANARPGERVYLHENHNGQVNDYLRNGMLRRDLRFVYSTNEADLVAYQYHQEFREQEFQIWEAFGTTKPVTGLYLDETPQIVVYRRK